MGAIQPAQASRQEKADDDEALSVHSLINNFG
jgi:hypothetical protein